MKSKIVILIGVMIILCSMGVAHAGQDNVKVNDGDDVIQTDDGKLYIGVGLAFQGNWVTLFKVRYPESGIGAVSFHGNQVTLIYHKGALPPQ